MEFGINKHSLKFVMNPYLIYLSFKRKKLLRKHKGKSLLVGNNSSINNSKVGYHVYLGNQVQINDSTIGDHTYINSKTEINKSILGKFCSVASNVKFGLGSHPTNLISTHPSFYSNKHAFKTYADKMYFTDEKKIKVGNDVWIGEDAIIMKGIEIGDGAIVAAGAIVTKSVMPYEIVGGIPAKHIKYRFNDEIIDKIRQSKWWDNDEEWFEENYKLFLNQNKFLTSLIDKV